MSGATVGDLSARAKLVRLVLANQGPLSPCEVASEALLSEDESRTALAELEECGLAERVCGMCATREEVYALVADGADATPDANSDPGADEDT